MPNGTLVGRSEFEAEIDLAWLDRQTPAQLIHTGRLTLPIWQGPVRNFGGLGDLLVRWIGAEASLYATYQTLHITALRIDIDGTRSQEP